VIKQELRSTFYRRFCMANLEGQKAPAFTLPGSDGKKHSLSDYAGKNVILWFYPKDDTPG
jgi:thioredoxin-dependent peroxiredoxin